MVCLLADLSILTARAAGWLTRVQVFQTEFSLASAAITKLAYRSLLTACAISPRLCSPFGADQINAYPVERAQLVKPSE
jgi:hypothetical protein